MKMEKISVCGDCKWFQEFPRGNKSVPGYGSCESPKRLDKPGGMNDWVHYGVYYVFACFIKEAIFEAKGDAPNIGG